MSIRRRIKVETRDRKDVLNEAVVTQEEFLEKFLERPNRFQFLFGAGFSASAGVPLSQQIIDEIVVKVFEKSNPAKRGTMNAEDLKDWLSREKWYNVNFAYISALEKEYPSVYLRTELFRRYMKGRFPSPGQLMHAIGVKEDKLNPRCYTTNWDTLTEDAFYWLRGTNCVTIRGIDQLREVKDPEHRYVIKLHGDLDRYEVRYLREGMAKHNDDLKDFLVQSLSNVGLVVVGYSGLEYSVMNMLMELTHDHPDVLNGGLYWGYQGNMKQIPESITDLLAIGLDRGKNFRIFEAEDSDFLFEKISQSLHFTSVEDELAVAFYRFNKMPYGQLRARRDARLPQLHELVHRDLLDEGFLIKDYNAIHEQWKSDTKGVFKKKEEKDRVAADIERKLMNHCFNELKHQNYADAEVKIKQSLTHFPENEMFTWGLGWALLNTGRYNEALAQFDKAVSMNPNNIGTLIAKSLSYHLMGNAEAELSAYDRVLEKKAEIDYIWYDRGLAAHKLGNLELEQESYEAAVSYNSGNFSAWYNLGLCFAEQGKSLRALAAFRRGRDINPKLFEAVFNTGILLGRIGQDSQAVKAFDACIALNQHDDDSFKQRGVAELMVSDFTHASESFDEYLHAQPEDPEVWANQGLALYGCERLDEAEQFTERYLQKYPTDARVWYNKGLILDKHGSNSQAMQAFDKSLELNNDYDMVWYRKALLLGELGDYRGEIEYLTRFLNRNDQDFRGWFELGEANRKLGEAADNAERSKDYYEAAVRAYDKALDIQRTDLSAWLMKTVCLNRLGQFKDALECIEFLRRYDKNNAEIFFQKGIAEDGLGDQLAAVDTFAQTLKLDENHADAYYRRGILLAELEQFAKAVDHFDEVIKRHPERWQPYHYKGVCIIRQKDYEKALEVFNVASGQFPKQPRFFVDLALAHTMKREMAEAKRCLQQALELDPTLRGEVRATPEFASLGV
jgi:tetratricopeptide (TPR) repeat protein